MDHLRHPFFFLSPGGLSGLDRSDHDNAKNKNDRPNLNRPDNLANPGRSHDLTEPDTDELIHDLTKDLPPKTRRLIFAIIIIIGALIDGCYSIFRRRRSNNRQP